MKAFFSIAILALFSGLIKSQEKAFSYTGLNPWGVSISLVGPANFVGLKVDRMLGQHFNLEAGLGFPSSVTMGGKYFLTNPEKKAFNWNVGYSYSYSGVGADAHYVPIGFTWFTKNNFQFSLDAGPSKFRNDIYEETLAVNAGLKIGYRFGTAPGLRSSSTQTSLSDEEEDKRVAKNRQALTPGIIGFNLNAGGLTPFVGISLDVLIANRLMLEAGLGLLSLSGGVKYFIIAPQVKKTSYYTGYEFSYLIVLLSGAYQIHYLPIGVSYFPTKKFMLAFDIGPSYFNDLDYGKSGLRTYLGARIGFRFL